MRVRVLFLTFTTTTTAGDPMHSNIDGHSDTSSC
jgi:hypothetical protein